MKIVKLNDAEGNGIYPVGHSDAIKIKNQSQTLTAKLSEIDTKIDTKTNVSVNSSTGVTIGGISDPQLVIDKDTNNDLVYLRFTKGNDTYSVVIPSLRVDGNALQYSNDGEYWTTIQTFGKLTIKYVQASDPASGDEGDLALVGTTNAYVLKVYTGGSWISVGDFGTLDLTSDGITMADENKTLTQKMADIDEAVDVVVPLVVLDKNSCVLNWAFKADGSLQTTGVGTQFYVSDYIEIPSGANKIVHSGIVAYTTNLSYGCIFNSSKVLLYKFQGDGVIDLSEYPSAKYVAIGINTNVTPLNPHLEVQTVSAPSEELMIDTVHDVVTYNQDNCTISGHVISRSNGAITTGDSGYKISDYIDISQYDFCNYSLWNDSGSSSFAGAALYDESHNPVAVLSGNGVIEFKDYPTAKYIVIATHMTHKRVGIELGKGEMKLLKQVVESLSDDVALLNEKSMYEKGSGIQNAGNIDTTVATDPASSYHAIGVADSAAEHDGTITSVSFCAKNTGTIYFMVGIWDETHEYFNARATYTYSVASTGIQMLTVEIPIHQGETLMVDMSVNGYVKIKEKDYTNSTPPSGSKCAIIYNIDNNFGYHKYSSHRTYLAWAIDWNIDKTIKEKVTENANALVSVENECGTLGQKVSELESSKLLIQGNDGKVYRLIVTNGVLGVENTTPQNILVLAHSFACILTTDQNNPSPWQRGMSSSKVTTDWVSQINSVFLPTTVNRVSMKNWELAFPNPPSSQLSVLDSYLNGSIDAIFIMLGANVPGQYQQTQQYAQTNFAALVNYCKAGAENADIYVCSPGYTVETSEFNKGIKAGAESAGATYISTYSTQADKLANYGDVVWDSSTNTYSFVINSAGRVNHPNDLWHLFMANNILSALGYHTLEKYRNISYNASVDYRGYTRWVAGGHCTVCTFGNSQPTVSIVDSNNNAVSFQIMDLSGVTWESTPSRIPKYAIHFDMPDSDVTISIQ